MTTAAQLRKTASSLPEAVEGQARGGSAEFTVGGKRFCLLTGDRQVELKLPAAEAEEVTAAHQTARRVAGGVRIPLADINGQQLNHWLRRAWIACAPKRLTAAAAAADNAQPGQVGDLPKAIGGPATRALANAGVTSLAQVAKLSDAELSAMHGVGPKAVRLLREAIG